MYSVHHDAAVTMYCPFRCADCVGADCMAWESAEDYFSDEEWDEEAKQISKIHKDWDDGDVYMWMCMLGRCSMIKERR